MVDFQSQFRKPFCGCQDRFLCVASKFSLFVNKRAFLYPTMASKHLMSSVNILPLDESEEIFYLGENESSAYAGGGTILRCSSVCRYTINSLCCECFPIEDEVFKGAIYYPCDHCSFHKNMRLMISAVILTLSIPDMFNCAKRHAKILYYFSARLAFLQHMENFQPLTDYQIFFVFVAV